MSVAVFVIVSVVTLAALTAIVLYEVHRRKNIALTAERERKALLLQRHERWKNAAVSNVIRDWTSIGMPKNIADFFMLAPNEEAREAFAAVHFEKLLAEDVEKFSHIDGYKPFADEWFDMLMEDFLNLQHFNLDWQAPYIKRGSVLEYEVGYDQSIADVNADYEARAETYWAERRKFQEEKIAAERKAQAQFDADMKVKREHEQKLAEESTARKAAAKKEWANLSPSERRSFRNSSQAVKVKTLVSKGHDYSTAVMFVNDFYAHVPDSSTASDHGGHFSGSGDSGSFDSGSGDSGGGGDAGGGGSD